MHGALPPQRPSSLATPLFPGNAPLQKSRGTYRKSFYFNDSKMAFLTFISTLAWHALGILLVVLFLAFLCFCVYVKYMHLKSDHIPGPPRER